MITLYIHNLEEVGKRLDHYLVSNLDDHSRSQIQSWIRSGSILVKDRSVKTGYSLELNDQILIDPPKVEDSAKEFRTEFTLPCKGFEITLVFDFPAFSI